MEGRGESWSEDTSDLPLLLLLLLLLLLPLLLLLLRRRLLLLPLLLLLLITPTPTPTPTTTTTMPTQGLLLPVKAASRSRATRVYAIGLPHSHTCNALGPSSLA